MSTNREIVKSTAIIILITILAKAIGIITQIVVASKFGLGKEMDIFYISVMIPMLLVGVIGGCTGAALIPIYTDYRIKKGSKEAGLICSSILNVSLLALIAITVSLAIFAKHLIPLAAPGFKKETIDIGIKLALLVFPILIFGGMNVIFQSIINAHKHFKATSIAPMLVPISIIVIVLFGSRKYGIISLAFGNLLGFFLVGCLLILVLKSIGVGYSLSINLRHPGVKKIFNLMLPLIVGATLVHINVVVDKIMASTLLEGSVSALGYADKIINVIQAVFIISFSTAILPYFSEEVANNNIEELKRTLNRGIKMLAFIFAPITVGIAVLAKPLIMLLYQRGAFTQQASIVTSGVLLCYCLGLYGMALIFLLTRAFYALKDTKTSMFAAIISVFFNIVLNIILMRYMGVSGIAFSTSLVSVIVVIFLFFRLRKKFELLRYWDITKSALKIWVLALTMGLICHLFFIQRILNSLVINFLATVLIGIVVYGILSFWFKIDEFNSLYRVAKEKFRK